ncbi:MAG: PD-(D/E)XK nuclease family protein [Bacteroidota bacterium]|nr:PD-(D/E)XK nuclease family protein [Bacteroidota bacterium]MDP3144404.1 PD-(D/E)XK nuclease family protein [Bacteroidota bacterium]
MAKPFLKLIAEYVFENYKDNLEQLCIILPNKRGALFLKNYLAQTFGKTIWLPTIISAEDLIAELSELKTLEEIDLICYLYDSYKICYGSEAENFDSFAKWGQLILQDFNEIDRYLADSEQLYENLKDIKVLENWSLGAETLSEYQTNYLKFMNSLGPIYKHFSNFLVSKKWAYQGLAYKHAVLNFDNSNYPNQFYKLIFCGFNALNAAELNIFNKLYLQKKADILWDADEYYLKDKNQEAGLFLRNNFNLFQQREPSFIQNNFIEDKTIQIISVPKQIGQAQVVKQTVQKFIDDNIPLDKVAIVLANEKLLWPVLQQLPSGVEHVNITMEYPLRYTSTYSLIEQLLQLQLSFSKQTRQHKTIYHKDLIALLRQPIFATYLRNKNSGLDISKIINQITERNISFITSKNLTQLFNTENTTLFNLLQPAKSVSDLCSHYLQLLQNIKELFIAQPSTNQSSLELEYLQIIIKNFNRLTEIIQKYPHFNDVLSFKQLFGQIVGNSSAPFIGEPLRGLQIMGVLETRTLDFDHVVFVNVNESVLPSGKTVNSFIPNDLKRAFGLPLYIEKDAIYAYHFYRLLQRASDVVITYDSETDTFGKGEKSRFVTQLQLEMQVTNPNIKISEEVALFSQFPKELENVITIIKDEEVLSPIYQKAISNQEFGALSPSGLISFKECSLKFYFRYGAKLKETKEVEESAEANTFGSILHLSLENLYKGFIGKILNENELKEKIKQIESIVHQSFISFFDNSEIIGKGILQKEVIQVYVEKLIKKDIRFVNKLKEENQYLTLKNLEQELSAALEIDINGVPTTIYIKGKIDRIDSHEGKTRIIDYKSSLKSSDKFSFTSFDELFLNTEYNKQFQLFMYAWLLFKNNYCAPEQMQPCIIPFKNFLEEPKYISRDKNPLVFTKDFLIDFENELKRFVENIFENTIPFSQTEDEDICEYCAYNVICNRQK